MRYWNGYQWKNGQAPAGSGRITECASYDEFKQVFGGRAEETDAELKERIKDAFVPPPRSDIEGYYVGESHPSVAFGNGVTIVADPACPLNVIKLGCHTCTFTWEEPDRDDMIMTPDHNSHFTEPCEGSGEPAVCL